MALLYLGLFSSVLMLLSIPLTFFAMFKRLDAAESYVEHTDYVIGHKKTLRFAPFEGRASRVVAMAIIILIPKVLQWRRLIRVEDVQKIPTHLKFWMVFPTTVALISSIGMVISWLFLDPELL
jgi:ABC-type amino acid transport system permease subunit